MASYLSQGELVKLSGLSNSRESAIFDELCTDVAKYLQDQPSDSIGLIGPGKGPRGTPQTEAFHQWVENHLDGGIGQKYWGPTAQAMRRLDSDRALILRIFASIVINNARKERRRRIYKPVKKGSALKRKQEGKQPGDEKSEDGELSDGSLHESITKFANLKALSAEGLTNYTPPQNPQAHISTTRKHASESVPLFPSKGLKRSKTALKNVARHLLGTECSPDLDTPSPDDDERIFETRLGDNKTTAFLFARPTISFEQFFDGFCEVWGKGVAELDAENVQVKLSITGAGDYQLSFGLSRGRSWLYLMKVAGDIPNSSIMVTVYI